MILLAIILTAAVVYFVQSYIYKKHIFDNLFYDVSLSAREVFVGEDIFMYEEIVNAKRLPISSVRVDMSLPHGLRFRMNDNTQRKKKEDSFIEYNQSVFVMRGNEKIRRRWRLSCQKRGVYRISKVVILTNDLLGLNSDSMPMEIRNSQKNNVVVLPRAIDLEKHFTSSYFNSGDVIVMKSLLTDPMLISGSREYTSLDPMKAINWKSTASHGKLMVNVEDYTEVNRFNVILNMQSRPIELHVHEPSSPDYIEMCITVCASILDKVSADNIPIRLFMNTPPESIGLSNDVDDETGKQILFTPVYKGKENILEALRFLATLKLEISCQFDKMMDYISQNPYLYSDGGNIIIVSSYIDERMINFHQAMGQRGIKVVFYVVTANQNAIIIPDNIEVYFKTYIE